MRSQADTYFANSENWRNEQLHLRQILQECGLDEGFKWGKPCYSHQSKNVAIIQGMKNFLALMFFKGALLKNPDGILVPPGPNSNAGRQIRFHSVDDVIALEASIKAFVCDAIEIEKAGLKVEKSDEIELPDELIARLEQDYELKAAFDALTPGRQRGYSLFIAGAKQTATRMARIDKHRPRILQGKGMHDR
ncbi:YdeI/OmpD-associated family protein [Thalassospira australica]|uniref:YdeI/OmpD-associated family protein n=1 Tax=Thalassospira australica TaxID=1528106 RepID=UPI00051A73DF|nr:DUF1801 domain-containing protein [Thalassospira australica]